MGERKIEVGVIYKNRDGRRKELYLIWQIGEGEKGLTVYSAEVLHPDGRTTKKTISIFDGKLGRPATILEIKQAQTRAIKAAKKQAELRIKEFRTF